MSNIDIPIINDFQTLFANYNQGQRQFFLSHNLYRIVSSGNSFNPHCRVLTPCLDKDTAYEVFIVMFKADNGTNIQLYQDKIIAPGVLSTSEQVQEEYNKGFRFFRIHASLFRSAYLNKNDSRFHGYTDTYFVCNFNDMAS